MSFQINGFLRAKTSVWLGCSHPQTLPSRKDPTRGEGSAAVPWVGAVAGPAALFECVPAWRVARPLT